MDPKVKNLIKFLITRGTFCFCVGYAIPYISGERDPLRITAGVLICIALWRILLSIYRRMILPPKAPKEYGRWAIVTGSTSGIGKAFIEYLAELNMNVLAISRSEDKLAAQVKELRERFGVKAEYLVFDFTKTGQEATDFYARLSAKCCELRDGDSDIDPKLAGIGLLINNVGTANEYPKALEEFTDDEVDDMIQCNVFSTLRMTRTVMRFFKERKNGCIVNISSGSGNHPTPMLAIYSATKAFITQFSRSMHVECWGSGVDHLVVHPYYVVSNLYKRSKGTLIAPMPIELVKGTLAQLGKQYIWQGHGYWFHGFLGNFAAYYWGTTARWKKMMKDNRDRYDAKQQLKSRSTTTSGKDGSKEE